MEREKAEMMIELAQARPKSANGALYTFMGRSPMKVGEEKNQGLKARPIGLRLRIRSIFGFAACAPELTA